MSRWWWSRAAEIVRWPDTVVSYVISGGALSGWDRQWLVRSWETVTISIVDDVVWSLVMAFESVALVSMLCFFFLFCGCTV